MLLDNLKSFDFKEYDLKTFAHESNVLKDNPLKDSFKRNHPVLLPKEKEAYDCVVYLSGFSSNGTKNFNFKGFEKNFVEEIDIWTQEKAITPKIFLFIDAWTFWGGSQFINSEGCGCYEDYIVKELIPDFKTKLGEGRIKDFIVMGGSSGGYGALHLSSKFPELFRKCVAIAPDCDFELSLKTEIYHALSTIMDHGSVFEFYKKLKAGEVKTHLKSFFTTINAVAMAACYSDIDENGMPIIPVNLEGSLDEKLWLSWLEKDPVYFLQERIENLRKLKSIFLSVGEFDQFLLQYGARKIRKLLIEGKIDFVYEEFRGDHFDIGSRRKKALSII